MSRSPSRLERGYYGRGGCGDLCCGVGIPCAAFPATAALFSATDTGSGGAALAALLRHARPTSSCARETIETFPPLPRMVAGSLRLQPAETGDVERDHGQARTPTRASSVALESGRPDDNFSRVGDAS